MSEGDISFVALVTREGLYEEGEILDEKNFIIKLPAGAGGECLNSLHSESIYGLEGRWIPLFTESQLRASPDFEMVEELWMPKIDESIFCIVGESGNRAPYEYTGDLIVEEIPFFRTKEACQNAIDESNALIKKLSDESRGKKG